jgi:Ca2+-binding RTX toxin-like protein
MRITLEDTIALGTVTLAGHLYLVARDDGEMNGDGDVIRGGNPTGLLAVYTGPLNESLDRYEPGQTEATHHARSVTGFGGTTEAAWSHMSSYAQGINQGQYDYEIPPHPAEQRLDLANSNAVVFSALNSIGIDARSLPDIEPPDASQYPYGFPGAALSSGYSGMPTLLGSSWGPDPERIVASTELEAGVALLGRDHVDDTLIGTRFADAFYGEQEAEPDATTDTVSYERSDEAVTVTLEDDGRGTGQGGHAEGDTYLGIECLTGSEFNDTLGCTALLDLYDSTDAATLLLRSGGGHDVVETPGDYQNPPNLDEPPFDFTHEIRFEGLDSDNVELVWEYENVNIEGADAKLGTAALRYGDEDTIYIGDLGWADVADAEGNHTNFNFRLAFEDRTISSPDEFEELFDLEGAPSTDLPAEYTAAADQTLNGGAGSDTLRGRSGSDNLNGGDSDDVLDGGTGDDVAQGEAGDDRFVGAPGDGDDTYNGGDGSDTVLYVGADQGVTVDLRAGTGTGPDVDDDTLVSIENAESGTGDDVLRGTDGANRLAAGAGNDTVTARAGNDLLLGDDGDDTLAGEGGNDELRGGGERRQPERRDRHQHLPARPRRRARRSARPADQRAQDRARRRRQPLRPLAATRGRRSQGARARRGPVAHDRGLLRRRDGERGLPHPGRGRADADQPLADQPARGRHGRGGPADRRDRESVRFGRVGRRRGRQRDQH